MQRVTIIRPDNVIYVDGTAVHVDCTSIAPSIHAIQWNAVAGRGSIEFVDDDPSDGTKPPNQSITSVAPYQRLIDAAMAAL